MTTQTARDAMAVPTNGEGKRTTAHLNLTVTMAQQVRAQVEDKARHITYSREQRAAT